MRLVWVVLVAAACQRAQPRPAPPSCSATAEHVHTLLGAQSDIAHKTRDVIGHRCQVDGWAADARECMVATTSLRRPRQCKEKLTAAQRTQLDESLAVLRRRTPPAACEYYREMVDKLSNCRAMPEVARSAFEQGYRQMAENWLSGAQYDVHKIEVQCRSLAEGLRMVMAPTCGW